MTHNKVEVDLKRLKAERIAKDYTQEYMASQMGYKNRASYAKRENGQIPLGANELAKIGDILGYSTDQLSIFFKIIVPNKEHIA